jgi:hypothetical protein
MTGSINKRAAALAAVLAAALLPLAPRASAQETGTPVYAAPDRAFASHEVGFTVSSPNDADLGLEGFFGFASGRNDWGIRVGFVDRGQGTDFVLGGRYRARIVRASEDFPLDAALTVGVGGSFDGGSTLRVPIGLSLGRRFGTGSSGVSLTPYLHPVLVPTFRHGDSELALAAGLGLDLRLARRLDVRVSGSFGDIEGFAVGIAWVR